MQPLGPEEREVRGCAAHAEAVHTDHPGTTRVLVLEQLGVDAAVQRVALPAPATGLVRVGLVAAGEGQMLIGGGAQPQPNAAPLQDGLSRRLGRAVVAARGPRGSRAPRARPQKASGLHLGAAEHAGVRHSADEVHPQAEGPIDGGLGHPPAGSGAPAARRSRRRPRAPPPAPPSGSGPRPTLGRASSRRAPFTRPPHRRCGGKPPTVSVSRPERSTVPGSAPVCSPPRTISTPLTMTCSTPRASA